MPDTLLSISNLNKSYGGIAAIDDLSLQVKTGEMHALIGPNGAGKTTLIAQLAGMLKPDSGAIEFNNRDITRLKAAARSHLGLARSFQISSIFKDFSCIDNITLAIQAHAGHSFRFWQRADKDPRLQAPAMKVLQQFGLQERANVVAGNLAHGEQRLLELALAIATKPKLLLLDEPMAGLGTEESARMTNFLNSLKRRYTLLLVEHDMDTVFKLADRISVLVYGRVIATGGVEEIRQNVAVKRAYLGE